MAATIKIGLQFFPQNLSIKANNNKGNAVTRGKFLRVSFNPSENTKSKRRFSLMMSASSHHDQKVETINGRKVNGVHVAEAAAPPIARKLSHEEAHDICLHGRFVDDRLAFRQIFVIRSYEIGPDKTASMETIMNFLQETALNHVANSGIYGNGFGATREMTIRKLIWVVTRIQVQIQRHCTWGDEIEVDTWVNSAGKNGMRRDWIIRDPHTKEVITRATSTWVIMHKETRKLSKMPEQVRQELAPFYFNRASIATDEIDSEKIDKLSETDAERIQSGLAPRWNDMDANQHVNNVRYIGWILECLPLKVLEEFSMRSMTLEFRRECTQSNLLESLASPTPMVIGDTDNRKPELLRYTHLLRLADTKSDVVRARTEWHSKQKL